MKQHGYSNDDVPTLSTTACANLPRRRNAAVRIAKENNSKLYSSLNNSEIMCYHLGISSNISIFL
jgi:hypothetical protein